MDRGKKNILVFAGGYLPGYKGGGTIRSMASLVEILGDEFDFRIVTLDRDLGSHAYYPGIKVNEWQKVGKAEVFYLSPENVTFPFLRRLINSTVHDALYLNSFFSSGFTVMPMLLRRLGLIQSVTTIVAPRGEFSQGALKIKPFKKKMYIYVVKKIGLYRNVVWQASSAHELIDIRAIFGEAGDSRTSIPVVIAPDLSNPVLPKKEADLKDKKPGTLKVVFLSRISAMKNLDGALRMLQGVTGEISFHIYGPLEDMDYWGKCQGIIDTLPLNIQAHYKGPIDHDEVAEVFSDHDLFFLPTHGENFGHVIIEALVAGCPILISDRTPWRELEANGVGWDLSLDRPETFTAALQQCADMGCRELRALSQRAQEYGKQKAMDNDIVQQNRNLFNI